MKSIVLGTALCASLGLGFTIGKSQETALVSVDVDPQQCIQEKCPNQWAACQKDPKCPKTLEDCQKKCGTKTTCWEFCLSKAGDSPATDVAKCASANHCIGQQPEPSVTSTALVSVDVDPQQCIQEKCPNQWAACQKDPKCPKTLEDCQKKCGTKTTCWEFCLSKAGDSPATDVAKCASANHCIGQQPLHPFEQCMSKSCSTAFSSCIRDDECRADLRHCRNVEKVWDFSFQCLVIRSQFNKNLSKFFTCAGESKCI